MKKPITLILVLLLFTLASKSQDFNLNETIPVDPSIIKGKLDNGLTYYVKENKMPENRVEMRLVVNAGSIQEDDDQLGLAHFLEHMCFNGTKHFEEDDLVDFLEETGVKFGPDLNAYTSFDQTVYFFKIPTDRPTLIDTGLLVLSEWAQNVTFAPEEIDKERGVVVEEWRLRLGADDRMSKVYWPEIFKGSRYAERLPIGDTNVILNCKYETVTRFYEDWYRPDLFAIVIVGDINGKEMEAKIKETFSSIPIHPNPRERKTYDIPDNKEPIISMVTDVEAPYISLELFYKHDKKQQGTIGIYREFIKRQLYNGMMQKRLSEILQEPDAPFLYAATQYSSYIGRTKDFFLSFSVSKEGQIEASLKQMLLENQRVKQHGFTQGELERQKKEIITYYEKALKELGKTESNAYANEFTRNYLENEPIPGIKTEYEYVKQFLPELSVDQINALAKEWIIDHNLIFLITGPDKEGLEYPTKEEILKIIKDSKKEKTKAYIDNVDNKPLLEQLPAKGSVKKEDYNKELGFYEFQLSNGVKVIAKKTDFKNDEILLRAQSYGGSSLYGIEDIYSAQYASAITKNSGVGDIDIVSLNKKMAGSTASIQHGISSYSEAISGSCSPKDLKDLLTLNYLYFTQPRKDQKAFDAYISRLENNIKFMESDPGAVFNDTLTKILNSNDPRHFYILKDKNIDQISPDKTYQIFKERFADPSDFTFFFVGNIDIDSLKIYLEQYMASIPAQQINEQYNSIDPDFPSGITNFVFYKGIDPKASVHLFMNGSMKWDKSERIYSKFLEKALSIRLRKKIREDEGGTYGIRVSMSMNDIPEPEYTFHIYFGCDPEKTDTLYALVMEELEIMVKEGPTEEEMSKIKEIFIRERETALKENGFWLSALQQKIIKEEDIALLEEYKKEIDKIEISDVTKVAQKYINFENYVHAVLLPEEMKP